MLLAGIAEFAGRRPDDGTPGRAALYAAAVRKARKALATGEPTDPPGCDEVTADELMPVLRLSKGGAHRQVGLALALRYRLRGTWAALLDGRIDVIRARIIAEGTADLSPADAATVEAIALDRAERQTYVALGLAVGQADPAGAMKRRKRGEKQARVEQWREYDGTGALDYLRAVALIDRITGRDSRPSHGERGPEASAVEDWDNRDDWPAMDAWLLDQQGSEDNGGPDAGQDDNGEDGGGCGTEPPPSRPPPPGGRGRKRKQTRKRRGKTDRGTAQPDDVGGDTAGAGRRAGGRRAVRAAGSRRGPGTGLHRRRPPRHALVSHPRPAVQAIMTQVA
jgi:Domain of unknown function (DUF222)